MAEPVSIAVLDIDGVLADVRHRLHHLASKPKDWDGFFSAAPDDPLLVEGLEVAIDLAEDHEVVYLTGRPERCRSDTQAWLAKYGFPSGRLLMRSNLDRRPARLTKLEVLESLRSTSRVVLLVDDDRRVVDAAEDAGFVVRHATWMDSERSEQLTLRNAQASEGRS